MTGSPFIDKGKYEGKPIIFQSSLSNSIIVDNSDKNSLRVGTISMSTTNRHQDTTTLNSTNGTCTEGMLRSDSIDDEIHRPSNEYVLVRTPSSIQTAQSVQLPHLLACRSLQNVAFFSFLGFMAFQAVFAIIANSQSMWADSEAMSVDALTYLFNLGAEKIKSRPYTPEEISMPRWYRLRTRKLKRLYLELVPPLISVSTLIVVTVFALKSSLATLFHTTEHADEEVDVTIMLFFSALNLLLDLVNVSCFAKAHQAFGLNDVMSSGHHVHHSVRATEKTPLLTQSSQGGIEVELEASPTVQDDDDEDKDGVGMNLNMCSAWTVSVGGVRTLVLACVVTAGFLRVRVCSHVTLWSLSSMFAPIRSDRLPSWWQLGSPPSFNK
jgi:Co/Zn/Cd efflux system component